MVWSGNKAPDTDNEAIKALSLWVEDELERFSNDQIDNLQAVELRPSYNSPLRPRPGMIVYADGTKFDPNYGEGWYGRSVAGVWIPLGLIGFREVILANRTYYVRGADGNDANTGRVDSAAGAFKTLQGAYDAIVGSIDFNSKTVTVQVKDATYTVGALIDRGWVGGGAFVWQGNNGTPTNVVVSTTSSDGFKMTGVLPGAITIKDMQIKNTTSGNCINQSAAGLVQFQNIDFGASSIHLNCGSDTGGSGANLVCTGNYAISGGATFHVVCSRPSNTNIRSKTITITNTPAWGAAFAFAANGAVLVIDGNTFTGASTGSRYTAQNGAQIYTAGAGVGYLPGNAVGAGTNYGVAPWGLYV